jgi:hypothetical protein
VVAELGLCRRCEAAAPAPGDGTLCRVRVSEVGGGDGGDTPVSGL